MNTKRINMFFLYGFTLGLGLAIIFIPISTTIHEGNGVSATTYKEPMEYIVLVLRIAFITGFSAVLGSFYNNPK
ncbi:hypothetical protein P4V41_20565 [Fictibacillus nanhaiensis]|uniref:hypothetical protein n=1 Tax=Fictibacillus nanhaiensis TaxID=742169 RepID=UPI002E242656|nr:hypothetical protein [Fictibacillus nanhaiensis]